MSDKAHSWAGGVAQDGKGLRTRHPRAGWGDTIESNKPKFNKNSIRKGLHHVAQAWFHSDSSWSQHHRSAVRPEEGRFFQVCGRRGFAERWLPEFTAYRIRQVHGYANVIATQAGVSLKLPLLPPPGYPQITIEQNYAVVTGLTPIPRLNTRPTLDVAVPGFTVVALVGLPSSCPPDLTNPIEVMAAEILNPNCSTNPGPTELAEAAALKPTTAILWIGSSDALFSLLFVDTPPTGAATFSTLYSFAATTMAHASEHLVVANIPDVTLTAD